MYVFPKRKRAKSTRVLDIPTDNEIALAVVPDPFSEMTTFKEGKLMYMHYHPDWDVPIAMIPVAEVLPKVNNQMWHQPHPTWEKTKPVTAETTGKWICAFPAYPGAEDDGPIVDVKSRKDKDVPVLFYPVELSPYQFSEEQDENTYKFICADVCNVLLFFCSFL